MSQKLGSVFFGILLIAADGLALVQIQGYLTGYFTENSS